MSAIGSPPPPQSARIDEIEEQLDADIAKVRAEIEGLRRERSRLSAALLSSSKVQNHLKRKQQGSNQSNERDPLQQLANAQAQHNETNIHRLGFGVKSFPFTDPAPENKGQPPLLGIRFDVPTRNGKFIKQPYYVFLKRATQRRHTRQGEATGNPAALQIHHHTIPAHINIDSLAARYLPLPAGINTNPDFISVDEEEENVRDLRENSSFDDSGIEITTNSDSADMNTESQSLHLFTSHLRAALTSFHLRTDAATYLAEALRVHNPSNSQADVETGLYSVQSLSAPDPDARHIRIVWKNGNLGRLKINDDGFVERAVVLAGENNSRLSEAERALTVNDRGESVRVQDLVGRLKLCHERKYWTL